MREAVHRFQSILFALVWQPAPHLQDDTRRHSISTILLYSVIYYAIPKPTSWYPRGRRSIPANSSSSSSSAVSPGNRRPRVKPGGTLFKPLKSSSKSLMATESFIASSNPPGQKGTNPAFPLTKFVVGAGARSSDVDVSPLLTGGLRTC